MKEELTIENWKCIAKELWKLLDEIDTASDMFKPEFNNFYRYAMVRVEKRHEFMKSNGYDLFPVKYSKVDK